MVNREIKARKRAVKEEKEEIDGEIVRNVMQTFT